MAESSSGSCYSRHGGGGARTDRLRRLGASSSRSRQLTISLDQPAPSRWTRAIAPVRERWRHPAQRDGATRRAPTKPCPLPTPTLDGGQQATLDGTQYLTAGTYTFFCTLHPTEMQATLVGPQRHPAGPAVRDPEGAQQEARQGPQEGDPGRDHRQHQGRRRLAHREARQGDHRQGDRPLVRRRPDLPDGEADQGRQEQAQGTRARPRSPSPPTSPSGPPPTARRSSS